MPADTRLGPIAACVFDAYGTLFDFNSAALRARDQLGDKWLPLADVWRSKQLQYTWLRSLMGRHADFWQVTGDALNFALASLGIDDPPLRDRLLHLYLEVAPYPEVSDTLSRLKSAGLQLAILSNGSPMMLASAVEHAGIGALLDRVFSVEEVGVYKPHPSVYRLATDHFGVAAGHVCFVSSNAWDAHAAKAFGYRVVWCNRFGQPPEGIPDAPDRVIHTLAALPDLL